MPQPAIVTVSALALAAVAFNTLQVSSNLLASVEHDSTLVCYGLASWSPFPVKPSLLS